MHEEVSSSINITVDCSEISRTTAKLNSYLEFLTPGEIQARAAYEKTLNASRPSDNVTMECSWQLIGYEELLKQNNELIQEITHIANQLKSG